MAENPYQPPREPLATQASEGVLAREIVLHGSIPVRDVLHTQWLIVSKRWPYLAICLAIYAAFVLVLAMLNRSQTLLSNTFLILGLIVMPGIVPLSMLLVYMRLRRDSQKGVGIFAATESRLTQEGICASMHGETVSIPWSAFSGFLASHRVIVLFLRASNSHLIVSRNKLKQPQDWPLLLEFLYQRLPKW